MNHIYGVINYEGVHIDTSLTGRGAKRFATLNGYSKVSIRFNSGYNVLVLSQKVNGKWVEFEG